MAASSALIKYYGMIQGDSLDEWWSMDPVEITILNDILRTIDSSSVDEGTEPITHSYFLGSGMNVVRYEMYAADWWDESIRPTQGYHPGKRIFRRRIGFSTPPRHIFVFRPHTGGFYPNSIVGNNV